MKTPQTHSLKLPNLTLLYILLSLILFSLGLTTQDVQSIKKTVVSNKAPQDKKTITINVSEAPHQPIVQNQAYQYLTPTPAEPWGVSKQLGEHTYTIKVGNDPIMASAQDILDALNHYRQTHGSGTLSWDDTLASYAKSRTDYFISIGKLDEHAGFNDYLTNQDGFKKLGYANLGENSSIGYKLIGVHLIEWIYASDEAHNQNQLNPHWTNVGIGVTGTATDLIFGTNKF